MRLSHKGVAIDVEPFDETGKLQMIRPKVGNTLGFVWVSTRKQYGVPKTSYTPTAYIEANTVKGKSRRSLRAAVRWVLAQTKEVTQDAK